MKPCVRLVFLMGCMTVAGCPAGPSHPETTLEITPADFGEYNAVIVSLDEAKLYQVPEPLEGATVQGDLWLEPGDPELACLTSGFEDAIHVGEDTRIAMLPAGTYADIDEVPADVEWGCQGEYLGPGAVFLVSSSTARIYKLSIDALDYIEETATITFQEL